MGESDSILICAEMLGPEGAGNLNFPGSGELIGSEPLRDRQGSQNSELGPHGPAALSQSSRHSGLQRPKSQLMPKSHFGSMEQRILKKSSFKKDKTPPPPPPPSLT